MGKRTRNGKLEDYMPEKGMSLVQRVAHFLKYARDVRPGEWIAANALTKYVSGYGRMPHSDSLEVAAVRSSISRARVIARSEYDAEIVVQTGMGIRMTIGDDDVAEYALPRRVTTLATARKSLAAVSELCDPAKVSDQARAKWVRGVKAGVRELATPSLIERLLPPAAPKVE